MISYDNFKTFFEKLENGKEIEIIFSNGKSYLLVKYDGYITYGINSCDSEANTYNNLDNTLLKNNWSKVKDIIIDFAFSLINDKEDILNVYNFKF